jgi:leucyl-tRNA synthetase
MYLMFGFSYTEGGPWNDDGIKSISKFLDRIERLVVKAAETKATKADTAMNAAEKELDYVKNFAIKSIVRDVEAFSFNTSIARLMEYVNALQKYEAEVAEKNVAFFKTCVEDLVRMLAPFAPHLSEELWEICGHKTSIFEESYPLVNEAALIKAETEYAVQVNSKIKAKMMIAEGLSDEEIQATVCANPEIAESVEAQVRERLMKASSAAPKAAARAAEKAVSVSADDFDDED